MKAKGGADKGVFDLKKTIKLPMKLLIIQYFLGLRQCANSVMFQQVQPPMRFNCGVGVEMRRIFLVELSAWVHLILRIDWTSASLGSMFRAMAAFLK